MSSNSATTESSSEEDQNESESSVEKQDLDLNDPTKVFEEVMIVELKECKEMDIDYELNEYMDNLKKLLQISKYILLLKMNGTIDEEHFDDLKIHGLMHMTNIRRINRRLKLRLRFVKDEALAKRQALDSDHLIHQNLLYEAIHLKKQIATVKLYKGKDEDIDLVPVEEFYEIAPDTIAKDETRTDLYLQRVARLEHEYKLRQNLAEGCEFLEREKKEIANDIEDIKYKLDSVQPKLNQILEATKPLQEFFGIDIVTKKEKYKKSAFLPWPLYILFNQSFGYQTAFENSKYFSVDILGDFEAAEELNKIKSQKSVETNDRDKFPESENEFDDQGNSKKRRFLKTHSSFSDKDSSTIPLGPNEDPKKKILHIHPLSVEWKISSIKVERGIIIQFFYFTKLNIIAAKSTMTSGSHSQLLLNKIIGGLYDNDFGKMSPNPATKFLLESIGLDEKLADEFFSNVGRPYLWVQKLAGLDFPYFNKKGEVGEEGDELNKPILQQMEVKLASLVENQPKITEITFAKTIKEIRNRMINQSKLLHQVKKMEDHSFLKEKIPESVRKSFPEKKSLAKFFSWKSISWPEFEKILTKDHPLIEENYITEENSTFFKVEILRSQALFGVYISLGLNFPDAPPIFTIFLDNTCEEQRNSQTDPAIRELEIEMNFNCPKEFSNSKDMLLSLLLRKLLFLCDVLLETDSYVGPEYANFAKDKFFMPPLKGRNERRPLQYETQASGGGFFTQNF